MVRYSRAALFALSPLIVLPSAFATEGASQGIKPLTFLVGTWHGKSDTGQLVHARYLLTSGDSTLMETLTPEGRPAVTTMYHSDGHSLMLTHYSSLNNQPRMRAQAFRDGDTTLTFQFIDATGLKHPTDAHMQRVTFDFKDHDHFVQTWVLVKDGKETTQTFTFARLKQEGP